MTARRPSCNLALPRRCLVRRLALCALKWRRAKQARRACATSIPLGSGRRCGLPLLGAVYLCRGLFVPLKNVEHPLWLFRPSKKLLIHLGASALKHRRGRLWLWTVANYKERVLEAHKKIGFSSSMKHAALKTNVLQPWEEEGAKAARKLVWLDMSWGGWWWCASCRMTPNGQFWQSERRYLGTERIMQRSIYPGTDVGIPDTSLWNI